MLGCWLKRTMQWYGSTEHPLGQVIGQAICPVTALKGLDASSTLQQWSVGQPLDSAAWQRTDSVAAFGA